MMAEKDDAGDVFAIPDLFGPPKFLFELESPETFLISDLKLDDVPIPTDAVEHIQVDDDGFFAIPDLSFGSVDGPKTPASTVEASHEEVTPPEDVETDADMWDIPFETQTKQADYLSWNNFLTENHKEQSIIYISEAGPAVFDAALADVSKPLGFHDSETPIVDSYIYMSALLALGLSRNSVLFTWNEDARAFEPMLKQMRISGFTAETINDIQATFLSCGNDTKALQSFVDKTYSDAESPCRIALADAVSILLRAIQSRLNISPQRVASILQLEASFSPVRNLLSRFCALVQSISSSENDETLLSRLYEEVKKLEHNNEQLKRIFSEVLSRVSRPFLNFSEEWLGLLPETGFTSGKDGSSRSFVKLEERFWVDEQGLEMHEPQFVLDSELVPSFLSHEDAQVMFETGRSLRFLRSHHSDHPLVNMDVVSSADPPRLEWKFSWENILHIETKARRYEESLVSAIKRFSKPTDPLPSSTVNPRDIEDPYKLDLFGKAEDEMEAHILASMSKLNKPLHDVVAADQLSSLIDQSLVGTQGIDEQSTTFSPPMPLIAGLSFTPIIAAQARIVNGISLRLFFQEHKLKEHLTLQRDFQLLGNGVFSSRLSHALFDPELETAERQRGVARSGGIMGLRLGGRDTWPPASSELRLALMGVLTESYSAAKASGESRGGYLDRKSDLPGDLSFGVRDMSEEEIEKCKDPDSVEALDFLRLSYKPPAPLEAIITPMSLYKYDQLFKLLLRVLRMLYVVNQLFRDATDRTSYWQGIDTTAQRFRIEAHHFIATVSSYFFDTGVATTWKIFERKLDQIKARLASDDHFVILTQHEGLDKLEQYHERVLDRIMMALLLRKRQQPVMKLLEEIFSLVLQFAKHSRSRALGITRGVGDDEDVREMYGRFRKKVEVFITVCRGMSEKRGFGGGGGGHQSRKWGDGEGEAEVLASKKMMVAGSSGALFDADELLVEENTIVHLLARLEMSGYYSTPAKSVMI